MIVFATGATEQNSSLYQEDKNTAGIYVQVEAVDHNQHTLGQNKTNLTNWPISTRKLDRSHYTISPTNTLPFIANIEI
jgi:hypothetical protein